MEYTKNDKVVHTKHREWGTGTVELLYGDRSMLVRFPDRLKSYPNQRHLYRYYEKEVLDFCKI